MALRRPTLLLLGVAVLVGSAAVRLAGLDWLLPLNVEGDAHIAVQVRLIERDVPKSARLEDWAAYPHLVARLAVWLTAAESEPTTEEGRSLQAHLRRAAWPVLRVRWIVALLGLLAVPATWLLARRSLTPGWSLVAAAFMGTSLLALQFSVQARPHGAAVGLDALAVLACLRLRERGRVLDAALAGLAVAAAVACLQSGIATLLPLAAAQVGLLRERRWRPLTLIVPVACVALSLLAFYPFFFQANQGPVNTHVEVAGNVIEQGKHHVRLSDFNGRGFAILGRDLWEWEPALLLGALAALPILWGTRRTAPRRAPPTDRAVILSFVLPYALAIGLYALSYERFLLPLVPFLCVLATMGLARLGARPVSTAARLATVGPLLVLLLGFPGLVATRLAFARCAPSTFEQAAEWVRRSVSATDDTMLLGRTIQLPLFKSPASEQLDAAQPVDELTWVGFQHLDVPASDRTPAWQMPWTPFVGDDAKAAERAHEEASWLDALPGDLCIVEVLDDATIPQTPASVTTALRSRELLARFSPDACGHAVRLTHLLGPLPDGWMLRGLTGLRASCTGPTIEIYRLRPAAPR